MPKTEKCPEAKDKRFKDRVCIRLTRELIDLGNAALDTAPALVNPSNTIQAAMIKALNPLVPEDKRVRMSVTEQMIFAAPTVRKMAQRARKEKP